MEMFTYTYGDTHTDAHACTQTHTYAHTHAHTQTHMHAHRHTHICTHTHTDTHMHTHTHTHNLEYSNRSLYCSYLRSILSPFSMARTESNSSTTRSSTWSSAWVSHQRATILITPFPGSKQLSSGRHDWNAPTERWSQALCLRKAACFISDLLGWNLKRKTEERLSILNGHLITLATVQGRWWSKKDGRQDANRGVWCLWLSSWIN